MRKKLIWLFTLTCSAPAFAGPVGWTISEASGTVRISQAGIQKIATRGLSIAGGDTVTTGRDGRAVLVRGTEVMMVAPASQLHLPAQEETVGFTRVVEEFGNVVFMIKKKMTPHFEVKTPYLAAVVKGTTFSVGVTPQGASVQVLEGAVDVATSDGGAHDLITPGAIALVGATNRFRMQIEDNGKTRVVESPAAHDRDKGAQQAPAPVVASPIAAAGDVSVATPDATPLATSSIPAAGIAVAVYEPPVSLASTTNGLVNGNVGGDLAALGSATRIASESSTSATKTVQTAMALVSVRAGASQAMDNASKGEAASVAATAVKAAADSAESDAAAAADKAAADAAKAQANQQTSAATQASTAAAAANAASAASDAASAAAKAAADQQAKVAAQQQSSTAAAAAEAAAENSAAAAAKATADAAAATDATARAAADQAANEARQAADASAKAADDAAKAAAKAAADAAQASADKEAKDAARASADAAASQAASAAQQASADAAKATADKATKDAEEATTKAAKDAAKAVADAAKQQDKAAKDAQKASEDAAKAAAKTASDAIAKASKAAQDALKQIEGQIGQSGQHGNNG